MASNGVLLCRACHTWCESHRTRALADGWLVRQGQDPGMIPVLYRGSSLAHLREDGSLVPHI